MGVWRVAFAEQNGAVNVWLLKRSHILLLSSR